MTASGSRLGRLPAVVGLAPDIILRWGVAVLLVVLAGIRFERIPVAVAVAASLAAGALLARHRARHDT